MLFVKFVCKINNDILHVLFGAVVCVQIDRLKDNVKYLTLFWNCKYILKTRVRLLLCTV